MSGALAVEALPKSDGAGDADTAALRRARIGAAFLWERRWAGSLSADIANRVLGQMSIAYFGLPVHMELGRFPEPFGLIQQEVSAGQAFMELPMCTALSPGYGLGGAASIAAPRRSLSVGVFVPTPDADRLQHRPAEEAVTVRATGVPWLTSAALVHLGTAFSLRRPKDDIIRFASYPETALAHDLNTASAPLTLDHYSVLGLELGLLSGPALLQAEAVLARMPTIDGTRVSYRGAYAEAGWTFGAEGRGYRNARGVFGPVYSRRPVALGGYGAAEIAARYSFVDLTSDRLGDQVAAEQGLEFRDVYSGERTTVRSLGVNWYATDELKLSFARLDIKNEARSEVREAIVYQARLQVQFTQP